MSRGASTIMGGRTVNPVVHLMTFLALRKEGRASEHRNAVLLRLDVAGVSVAWSWLHHQTWNPFGNIWNQNP